ncbi:MAG: GNAT family N-acetyltransferase [Acidilobus sp.]
MTDAVQLVELTPKDHSLLAMMYDLYRRIFRVDEEAETLENLERYLKLKETDYYGDNAYHVIVALLSGDVIGFVIGDYYAEPSVAVIEFLGVREDMRGMGFGRLLESEFVRTAMSDASRVRRELRGVFIEVEDVERGMLGSSALFWSRLGYRFVPVRYIQPPLSAGKRQAVGLRLMFRPTRPSAELSGDLLLSFLRSYFKYAMSISDPEEREEYRLVEGQVKGKFLSLEDTGGVLVKKYSVHYFFVADLYPVSKVAKAVDVERSILSFIKSRCTYVEYGKGRSGEGPTPLLKLKVREYRDQVNLKPFYLSRRFIVRFKLLNTPEKLTLIRRDGTELELDGEVEVLGSYKSVGTLTIEVVFRGRTPLYGSSMIRLENPSLVKLGPFSLADWVKEELRAIYERLGVGSLDYYPLVIISSYEGRIRKDLIYGLVNLDESFWLASSSEVLKSVSSENNISVIKGILAFYEPSAALVVSKVELKEVFEELVGVPIHEFLAKFPQECVQEALEAEYAGEIEVLREQMIMLSSLYHFLIERKVSERIEEEYETLMDTEERIYRRLTELNVMEVGTYESLRRVLEFGQRRMGIMTLYGKVREALASIDRELDVRYQLSENRKLEVLEYLLLLLTAVQAIEAGVIYLRGLDVFLFLGAAGIVASVLGYVYLLRLRFRVRRHEE